MRFSGGGACEALYHGGTFDQYNMGASIMFEVFARRLMGVVDAYYLCSSLRKAAISRAMNDVSGE